VTQLPSASEEDLCSMDMIDCSLAGTEGCSNPVWGLAVCLLWMLCCHVVSAMGRSPVQESPTDCVCVNEYDQVQQ